MNKKKIISLLLTILLTTTSSVTAFATENKTINGISTTAQQQTKDTLCLPDDSQKNISKHLDTKKTQISKSSSTPYSSKEKAKSIQVNKNNIFSIKGDDNSSTTWSKFNVSNDGLVTINLDKIFDGNGKEENLYLVLENESGSEKYLDVNPFYNGGLALDNSKSWSVGLKAGAYYLKLESGFYAKKQIDVNFNISHIKDNFYEKELNDTLNSATPMDSSNTYKGVMYSYDKDYFVFNNTESNLSINLKQGTSKCSYSVLLHDSTGKDISPSSSQRTNDNTTKFNFNNIESGDVYIKVSLNDNSHYYQDFYELQLDKLTCGWVQENGKWYYYENGKKKTGLLICDNKKYLLGDDGARLTGWHNINNVSYYFNPNSGVATSGWMNCDNKWYYFNNNCEMQVGVQKIDGALYYFSDNGVMDTGWINYSGKWYYFNPESSIGATGWLKENGCWYYFNDSCEMVTGIKKIDGYNYFFGDNGVMSTGWIASSYGSWQYFNDNGTMKTGWFYNNGYWFYLNPYDGNMFTGLWDIDNQTYYFNSSGAMQTGWISFISSWKHFNSSGILTKGWLYENGCWYYLDRNGNMVTGFKFIDGRFYYFNDSGHLLITY